MFKKRQVYQAYKQVFDSPEARMVLADMCAAHSVFNGGFDPDPYAHAFNAGERNTVLRILTIINLSPEDILEEAQNVRR